MNNEKIDQTKLLVEIPLSLNMEINKFLADKSNGESTQGMRKILVNVSISKYLQERGWKLSSKASEDVDRIVKNGRFEL